MEMLPFFWLKISASKENWNYFQQVLFCKKKRIVENLVWTERLLLQRFFFLERRGRDGQFRFNQDCEGGKK